MKKMHYCFFSISIFLCASLMANNLIKSRKERMSTLRDSCCQEATNALSHIPKLLHVCAQVQEEITPLLQEFIEGDSTAVISLATREELCAATKSIESLAHDLEKGIEAVRAQVTAIKSAKGQKKS